MADRVIEKLSYFDNARISKAESPRCDIANHLFPSYCACFIFFFLFSSLPAARGSLEVNPIVRTGSERIIEVLKSK